MVLFDMLLGHHFQTVYQDVTILCCCYNSLFAVSRSIPGGSALIEPLWEAVRFVWWLSNRLDTYECWSRLQTPPASKTLIETKTRLSGSEMQLPLLPDYWCCICTDYLYTSLHEFYNHFKAEVADVKNHTYHVQSTALTWGFFRSQVAPTSIFLGAKN